MTGDCCLQSSSSWSAFRRRSPGTRHDAQQTPDATPVHETERQHPAGLFPRKTGHVSASFAGFADRRTQKTGTVLPCSGRIRTRSVCQFPAPRLAHVQGTCSVSCQSVFRAAATRASSSRMAMCWGQACSHSPHWRHSEAGFLPWPPTSQPSQCFAAARSLYKVR